MPFQPPPCHCRWIPRCRWARSFGRKKDGHNRRLWQPDGVLDHQRWYGKLSGGDGGDGGYPGPIHGNGIYLPGMDDEFLWEV